MLLGPVTWLTLAKGRDVDPFDFLDEVLGLYAVILGQLDHAGAEWVQIDEPVLVLDLDERQRNALTRAYAKLTRCGVKLMLTTYFGGLEDNLVLRRVACRSPACTSIWSVRRTSWTRCCQGRAEIAAAVARRHRRPQHVAKPISPPLLDRFAPVAAARDMVLAPSCSLLHVPVDLALEGRIDGEVKQWLAFAVQKIEELAILKRALNEGRASVADELAASADAAAARLVSPRVHDARSRRASPAATPDMRDRRSGQAARAAAQAETLALPAFPTTTIGSFPQTAEVRHARAEHNRGNLDDAAYERFLREETERAIRWQEEAGLDMLVHGEFERNDMVQYFGEKLAGFVFTVNGWVQSYGSRCVRPPILFGDVSRPKAMTVGWWRYAQSADRKAGQGHAHRPGDDPQLELRAR